MTWLDWMMNKIEGALLIWAGVLVFLALVLSGWSPARAGDQTATYFYMESALVSAGFKDRACGSYPTPGVYLDGERNCVRIPNTYLYKLDKGDGKVTKEVRTLNGTWKSTTVSQTTIDGVPVTVTESMDIADGRSVFGSFGVRNNWSLSDLTGVFGKAESAAERARFFATGLAATRTSEGGSDYLGKAQSLLPSNTP
jgi:hypothetical protein